MTMAWRQGQNCPCRRCREYIAALAVNVAALAVNIAALAVNPLPRLRSIRMLECEYRL
jgi:hypothetical protein